VFLILMALLGAAATGAAGFLAGLATMRHRVKRLASDAAQARWLAQHDPLTGLPNRTAARRHFTDEAAAGRQTAVALLDLDDFKAVNDTWGHHAGDALLVAIADRLAAACHDVGARVCRLGGDEFVLLIPAAPPEDVVGKVAAIVARLGAVLTLTVGDEAPLRTRPRASAGIAVPDGPGDEFSDLLRHADLALYDAKKQRTGPRLYSADLGRPASHQHRLAEITLHPRASALVGTEA
jgi:diguanylate cyclase (GGDEF)-like protein